MPSKVQPRIAGSTAQGLAFLTLLFFVVGFFAARIFTTIYPDVVVQSSGIHFQVLGVAGCLAGLWSHRRRGD